MGVDGVSAARRYQPIARPFGRHSCAEHKFLPRRPLPRQPWLVGAKYRFRYRSTANTATLTRLFCRIRALAFAMWAVTRIIKPGYCIKARSNRNDPAAVKEPQNPRHDNAVIGLRFCNLLQLTVSPRFFAFFMQHPGYCSQTIFPHVMGDAVTCRSRRSRMCKVGGFNCSLRRLRGRFV